MFRVHDFILCSNGSSDFILCFTQILEMMNGNVFNSTSIMLLSSLFLVLPRFSEINVQPQASTQHYTILTNKETMKYLGIPPNMADSI